MRSELASERIAARGAGYPTVRMRRLRRSEPLRSMVRETELRPSDLIYPMFVSEGREPRRPVPSMPGVCQLSVEEALRDAEAVLSCGVPAVLLFGIPEAKDELGSQAYAEDGIVQRAVRALKGRFPELVVITDVCMCEYTSHGHCGVLRGDEVDNDRSLELHALTALSHARAGADVVAPSGMMDGVVGAIRSLLDAEGFEQISILAYAAKYASGFYGPFRDAAGSAPAFGDRRQYQMDPANGREALREVALDVAEGADMIMVKPALAYLDVISRVRQEFDLPLVAYNVSGEYSMVKAATQQGWLDERRTVLELLTAMRRAGADLVITYHALDAARWLIRAEGA